METPGGVRRSSWIETKSPERAKLSYIAPKATTYKLKKAQVIYYLSRNGQLEHPHFMEVSLLPNQTLVLRDVIDKLRALRGKAVASLYSWSCKRTYKNGYVWNDLGEDDVIYPADGVEYILKGSEIADVESAYSGELHKIELTTVRRRRNQCKLLPLPQQEVVDQVTVEKKRSQCSRGVSTEEFDVSPANLSFSSSSEKPVATAEMVIKGDADPINDSSNNLKCSICTVRSPSLLLQLIACGSSAYSPSSPFSFCNNVNSGKVKSARKSLYEEECAEMERNIPRSGDLKTKGEEYYIMEPTADHNSTAAECSSINLDSHGRIWEEDKIESKIVKGKCIPGWRK